MSPTSSPLIALMLSPPSKPMKTPRAQRKRTATAMDVTASNPPTTPSSPVSSSFSPLTFDCCLCPLSGGPLTRTTSHTTSHYWTHIQCALAHTDTVIRDMSSMATADLTRMDKAKYKTQCVICHTKRGASTYCNERTCRAPIHVGCVTSNGAGAMEMSPINLHHPQRPQVKVYCPKHKAESSRSRDEHNIAHHTNSITVPLTNGNHSDELTVNLQDDDADSLMKYEDEDDATDVSLKPLPPVIPVFEDTDHNDESNVAATRSLPSPRQPLSQQPVAYIAEAEEIVTRADVLSVMDAHWRPLTAVDLMRIGLTVDESPLTTLSQQHTRAFTEVTQPIPLPNFNTTLLHPLSPSPYPLVHDPSLALPPLTCPQSTTAMANITPALPSYTDSLLLAMELGLTLQPKQLRTLMSAIPTRPASPNTSALVSASRASNKRKRSVVDCLANLEALSLSTSSVSSSSSSPDEPSPRNAFLSYQFAPPQSHPPTPSISQSSPTSLSLSSSIVSDSDDESGGAAVNNNNVSASTSRHQWTATLLDFVPALADPTAQQVRELMSVEKKKFEEWKQQQPQLHKLNPQYNRGQRVDSISSIQQQPTDQYNNNNSTSLIPLSRSSSTSSPSATSSSLLQSLMDTPLSDINVYQSSSPDLLSNILSCQYQLAVQLALNEENRSRLRRALHTTDCAPYQTSIDMHNAAIERAYRYTCRWAQLRASLCRGVDDHPLPPALLARHRLLYNYDVDEALSEKSVAELDSQLERESEERDDYSVCAVCWDSESEERSNPIVYCDRCNMAVHQVCYGIAAIPDNEWYCDYCHYKRSLAVDTAVNTPTTNAPTTVATPVAATPLATLSTTEPTISTTSSMDDSKVRRRQSRVLFTSSPVASGQSSPLLPPSIVDEPLDQGCCVLCPLVGGALKPLLPSNASSVVSPVITSSTQWVHIVCALWTPAVRIDDIQSMTPISGVETALATRLGTCLICNKTMGAVMSCSGDGCDCKYHPICAWYYGLYMTVRANANANATMNDCQYDLYCTAHTPLSALALSIPQSVQSSTAVTQPPSVESSPIHISQLSRSESFNFAPSPCPSPPLPSQTPPILSLLNDSTIAYRHKIRQWQQRELRQRGRQEHAKQKRHRRAILARARQMREDQYEIGRCAVCFQTDDDIRQFKAWSEERRKANERKRIERKMRDERRNGTLPSIDEVENENTETDTAVVSGAGNGSGSGGVRHLDLPEFTQNIFTSPPPTSRNSSSTPSPAFSSPPSSAQPSPSHAVAALSHENTMLRCDECGVSVHEQCYGVDHEVVLQLLQHRVARQQAIHRQANGQHNGNSHDEHDDEDADSVWRCNRCQTGYKNVDCALCPRKGGAFKQTVEGDWVHLVCAKWYPDISFADPQHAEGVRGVKSIPTALKRLRCYLCGRSGPCVECSESCNLSFHPLCGYFSGQFMQIIDHLDGDRSTAYGLCRRHTPLHLAKFVTVTHEYSLMYRLREQMDSARTLLDMLKRREKCKERLAATTAECEWLQATELKQHSAPTSQARYADVDSACRWTKYRRRSLLHLAAAVTHGCVGVQAMAMFTYRRTRYPRHRLSTRHPHRTRRTTTAIRMFQLFRHYDPSTTSLMRSPTLRSKRIPPKIQAQSAEDTERAAARQRRREKDRFVSS